MVFNHGAERFRQALFGSPPQVQLRFIPRVRVIEPFHSSYAVFTRYPGTRIWLEYNACCLSSPTVITSSAKNFSYSSSYSHILSHLRANLPSAQTTTSYIPLSAIGASSSDSTSAPSKVGIRGHRKCKTFLVFKTPEVLFMYEGGGQHIQEREARPYSAPSWRPRVGFSDVERKQLFAVFFQPSYYTEEVDVWLAGCIGPRLASCLR